MKPGVGGAGAAAALAAAAAARSAARSGSLGQLDELRDFLAGDDVDLDGLGQAAVRFDADAVDAGRQIEAQRRGALRRLVDEHAGPRRRVDRQRAGGRCRGGSRRRGPAALPPNGLTTKTTIAAMAATAAIPPPMISIFDLPPLSEVDAWPCESSWPSSAWLMAAGFATFTSREMSLFFGVQACAGGSSESAGACAVVVHRQVEIGGGRPPRQRPAVRRSRSTTGGT